MPRGRLGYKVQRRCGNIVILSDGKPEMGMHVEMSGQGCRQFDINSGRWRELISNILDVGGHFTRIDIAIDDRQGCFPLEKAKEKLLHREVRTRFRSGREITGVRFSDKLGNDGCSLYFGSAQSDIKIRIYDKAAEQRVTFSWIRVEAECRGKLVNVLAHHMRMSDNLGEIVAGVLKNYLTFVEPSADSNKARWPVSPWWDAFLGSVNKLQMTIKKEVGNIDGVEAYLYKQAAPSLALWLKANGGDLNCLLELIKSGEKRLKPHHLAMLRE
ncbi:hypothetical protein GSUET_34450 [Geobacter sulfurreducens subsp. ethanolicus]|nr:hypothetical protein GSUET_34450 [Geobacter sulfurreducens subsp. ethanolicus]